MFLEELNICFENMTCSFENITVPKKVFIPSGVPPTLSFKDLGLRTYAALLNNKSKQ